MPKGFEANRRFVDQLARSPEMSAAMQSAAKRGMQWAEQNSPRRTGEFAASWSVEPAIVTVRGKTRSGAVLVNDASRVVNGKTEVYAWATEWGRGGKHVLQRAVDVIERG